MGCLDDGTVPRIVRRIRHVEFLGQSGGQSAGQYLRLNKTRTVRRTVRGIMQIKPVLEPISDHMHTRAA